MLGQQDDPRPIAVIEPHYDDAWVNLGGMILLNPGQPFRIISLTEDPKNCHNETQQLPTYVPQVETVALRLQGLPWSFPGSPQEAMRAFCHRNGLASLAVLAERLTALVADCRSTLLPLGMEHPQHAVVSQLSGSLRTECLGFYREFPYFFPCTLRDFRNALVGLQYKIAHIRTLARKTRRSSTQRIDIRPVLEQKLQIFQTVYTSQAALLRVCRSGITLHALDHEVLFFPAPAPTRRSSIPYWFRLVLFEFLGILPYPGAVTA